MPTEDATHPEPAAQDGENDLTVQVYVRPELLLEPVDAKVETLRTLDQADDIDGLVLHYWPGKVDLSSEPPRSEAVDAFERFELWADRRGASVRPPFTVRERSSEITGEDRTVLSTPIMCLAVYEAGHLMGVYPHSDGDATYSVREAIAALRTGQLPPRPDRPSRPAADPAGRENGCPNCGDALVNVQGILACRECPETTTEVPSPAPRALPRRR